MNLELPSDSYALNTWSDQFSDLAIKISIQVSVNLFCFKKNILLFPLVLIQVLLQHFTWKLFSLNRICPPVDSLNELTLQHHHPQASCRGMSMSCFRSRLLTLPQPEGLHCICLGTGLTYEI